MPRRPKRSVCPVACTLDILGDRWTLLIVRDLLLGRKYFRDFLASPEGIASNVLTERLNRLVESGVLERLESPDHAGRPEYHLTPRGEALRPIVEAVAAWGLAHVKGAKARMTPKPH